MSKTNLRSGSMTQCPREVKPRASGGPLSKVWGRTLSIRRLPRDQAFGPWIVAHPFKTRRWMPCPCIILNSRGINGIISALVSETGTSVAVSGSLGLSTPWFRVCTPDQRAERGHGDGAAATISASLTRSSCHLRAKLSPFCTLLVR